MDVLSRQVSILSVVLSLILMTGCLSTTPSGSVLTVVSPSEGQVVSSVPFDHSINCGNGENDCTELIARNSVIELFAEPPSGYQELNWSYKWGGDCEGALVCRLDMRTSKQVSMSAYNCTGQAATGVLEYCLFSEEPFSIDDYIYFGAMSYKVYDEIGNLVSAGSWYAPVDFGLGFTAYYWPEGIDGENTYGNLDTDTASTIIGMEGFSFGVFHPEFYTVWDGPSEYPMSAYAPVQVTVDELGLTFHPWSYSLQGVSEEYFTLVHTREGGVDRMVSDPANTEISFYLEFAGVAPQGVMFDGHTGLEVMTDYVTNYGFTHHATGISFEFRDGVYTLNNGQGTVKECRYNTLDLSNAKAGNVTHNPELGCTVL